jgi:hypothetical protein
MDVGATRTLLYFVFLKFQVENLARYSLENEFWIPSLSSSCCSMVARVQNTISILPHSLRIYLNGQCHKNSIKIFDFNIAN